MSALCFNFSKSLVTTLAVAFILSIGVLFYSFGRCNKQWPVMTLGTLSPIIARAVGATSASLPGVSCRYL